MHVTILPKTPLGRWSVVLGVVWILLLVLSEVILGPGPDYNMALAYTLSIIDMGIAAAAFITGLISILKNKERSILVFLTTAIGLYGLIGVVSLLGLAK
jgi:hypothetical protein